MGVHQFLSWLRARHNTAFRTAHTSGAGHQDSSNNQADSPISASGSPTTGGGSARRKHGSLFEVATDSDYAVVAVDINAMLHEVASSVTNDQQSQVYDQVEREILRRLGMQIEELVRIAGGDSLKPRSVVPQKQNASDDAAAAAGVFTRDVLVRNSNNPRPNGDKDSNQQKPSGAESSTTDSTLFTLVSCPDGEQERAMLSETYTDHQLLPVDVLLVVDGVAPLGKCAQQRERRSVRKPYSSGPVNHDSNYFQRQQQMLLDRQEQQKERGGRIADQLGRESQRWDANAITVGTPFMHQVCAIVHYTAANLVRQYRNLRAFVSDASVPGEGEQKIFTALKCGMLCTTPVCPKGVPKSMAASSVLDSRRICICSNDTDSIIMALLLVDDEEVQRSIDVWRTPSSSQQMMPAQRKQQRDEEAATALDVSNKAKASTAANKGNKNPLLVSLEQEAQKSWVFDMSLFVQELKRDFHWSESAGGGGPSVPGGVAKRKRNFGGAMRSFAFMISIFGGDFLPRVSDLSIADGDLDDLIDVLGTELFVRDRWIVDPLSGTIDLQAAMYCLKCLADRKYGVNVVHTNTAPTPANNNNNNNTAAAAASSGATRRNRAGISICMGDVRDDSFNPFTSSNALKVAPAAATPSSALSEQSRELVSIFWEGLIWVGRYFDGVTVSWSWFFRHPGGGMGGSGSASHTFGGAPRLRDLISDETVLTGRASDMAARAVTVYQALLRQDFATMQAVQRQKPAAGSALIETSSLPTAASASVAATIAGNAVMTPEDINPVAVGASVLPDVSWPNLLPRALSEMLRKANDNWNDQRAEVQERRNRGEKVSAVAELAASSPKSLASNSSNNNGSNNKVNKNSFGDDDENSVVNRLTPEELAFEFIRSLKVPVTSFNPLVTVGLCSRLIASIQHRFTREELRLLKRRYTYRLNWASLTSSDADSKAKKEEEDVWRENIVSEATAAAAGKAWNEQVLRANYSDLLSIGAEKKNNNGKDTTTASSSSSSSSSIFPPAKNDDEALDLLFSTSATGASKDITQLFPHFDEISNLVQTAADSQRARQERAEEEARQRRERILGRMETDNNSSSSHPVGWYTVPGAIRFTGTASAANLTAFPTFSNTPVAAAGGGEAVMLQYAVQIPV